LVFSDILFNGGDNSVQFLSVQEFGSRFIDDANFDVGSWVINLLAERSSQKSNTLEDGNFLFWDVLLEVVNDGLGVLSTKKSEKCLEI
jgi:hypothetical protein